MYENITEEEILNRMLNRVNDRYDKREGSIIFDSLAPTALEHKNMLISLDEVMNEAFIDTMSLENLKRKGTEMGVPYKSASAATVKLQTNVDVPVGSQFTANDLLFTITEKISNYVYYAVCNTKGTQANSSIGDVVMTVNYPNLTSAKIIEISIEGEDDEETETYRNRLLSISDVEAFGGNKADYKNKVGSINGVGGVKVYSGREWNGGGTVKIVFTTSSYSAPTETLVELVQTTIDPEINSGDGEGLAPIGHIVTCLGAEATTIDITADFEFASADYTLESCLSDMQTEIDTYFSELNATWDDNENIVIRIASIISVLMGVEGIRDVKNITLNGSTNNLTIHQDSLVVRGTINEL